MVSVDEATHIIFSHLYSPVPVPVPVTEAAGRVLAEQVTADRDFPPFNRVAMDGVAISFQEWHNGRKVFPIQDIQAAGTKQKKLSDPGQCLEVMTGAVLPEGVDTVIRYEDLKFQADAATVMTEIEKGQNIHRQGVDAKAGSSLLEPGLVLSPAEIALLASVGKSQVNVWSLPRTALISSGDELVEVTHTPEPHQIRRSNIYALEAAMQSLHWIGNQYHLPDQKNVLLDSLKTIVSEHDVMILSGGVSKGKFDFIPEVMEEIGVKKVFHQVSQRPGKPFWFGVSANGKVVFALPGNPVSTYMCYYRYIEPWLMKSLGTDNKEQRAVLAKDFTFSPNLTYYLQVSVRNENGRLMAYPEAGGGSGDFANLKKVDGFLELPITKNKFEAGEVYPYFSFRN